MEIIWLNNNYTKAFAGLDLNFRSLADGYVCYANQKE